MSWCIFIIWKAFVVFTKPFCAVARMLYLWPNPNPPPKEKKTLNPQRLNCHESASWLADSNFRGSWLRSWGGHWDSTYAFYECKWKSLDYFLPHKSLREGKNKKKTNDKKEEKNRNKKRRHAVSSPTEPEVSEGCWSSRALANYGNTRRDCDILHSEGNWPLSRPWRSPAQSVTPTAITAEKPVRVAFNQCLSKHRAETVCICL